MAIIKKDKERYITFNLDAGENLITTGIKSSIILPFSGSFVGWKIISPTVGSCVIDIYKGNILTDLYSIIGGGTKPNLDNTKINYANGYAYEIKENDILTFNIDSFTNIKKITLIIVINMEKWQ